MPLSVDALEDLRKAAAPGHLLLDHESLELRSADRSRYEAVLPDAVAVPTSPEEAGRIVAACAKHGVYVVPRGAGSGLEAGCIAQKGGIVLDVMNMKQIEVNKEDMFATCGAGVLKEELNKHLASYGFILGPDPASNPSVGGMCSTSGSGLSTIAYGTTRENVVSLLVVLPDGQLLRTRAKTRKSSTGYDLTHLFIGGEGTLGVIVEVTFRLHRKLPLRTGALANFQDIGTAAACIAHIKAAKCFLIRCELLNREFMVANQAKYGGDLPAKPTLFFEWQGDDEVAIRREMSVVEQICAAGGSGLWRTAKDAEFDTLWNARRMCYFTALTYKAEKDTHRKMYIGDACVPVKELPAVIQETEDDFTSEGLLNLMCCHISDGNFHILVPYRKDQVDALKKLEHRMVERAIAHGGTISGEHGVGIGKKDGLVKEKGKHYIQLMRRIKAAVDPQGIMNPGNLFDILPAGSHSSCSRCRCGCSSKL